jgi:hypothetical protein
MSTPEPPAKVRLVTRDRWFTVAVQTVLILFHFVCLIMFLSFGFSGRDVEGRRATSVRIGLPSPWFTYETYPEPNVPFRQHIDFFSSSLLVAAVGFLAFYVYWRIEKTKADFKPGFWNTPKPMLIVWAMLALGGITFGLWFASIESRPKSVTPGPTQPKTGEEWFGNKGDEKVMFRGPSSPTVSDRLASHLGLDPSQRAAMNQAFQMFFREFKVLEEQNTRHEADANGHQITTIAPYRQQLPQLAERFWSELESALDGRQLTLGRKVVWLSGGMFASGDFAYRVEIWRVGQVNPWYHWKESYPGRANVTASSDIDPSSGPELPEKLRRFWNEPNTDDARIQGKAGATSDAVRLERLGSVADPVGFPMRSVAVRDNHAFVIQGDAEKGTMLRTIDVSDPSHPRMVGLSFPVTPSATRLAVVGDHVLVLDGPKLRVIDVSNPEELREIGSCEIAGNVWDLAVQGRFAYVTDIESVRVIDLENPAAPREVGRCDVVTAQGIYVNGKHAYVACDIEGLYILDISDPLPRRQEVDPNLIPSALLVRSPCFEAARLSRTTARRLRLAATAANGNGSGRLTNISKCAYNNVSSRPPCCLNQGATHDQCVFGDGESQLRRRDAPGLLACRYLGSRRPEPGLVAPGSRHGRERG